MADPTFVRFNIAKPHIKTEPYVHRRVEGLPDIDWPDWLWIVSMRSILRDYFRL